MSVKRLWSRKNATSLGACLCLLVGNWAAAKDLRISFEEEEGYRGGTLDGQKEWQVYGGNINEARVVPVSGALGGHASVKVTKGEGHLNKTLVETSLMEPVVFSVNMRLDPEDAGQAGHSRIFLSHSEPNRRFGGVSFGIEEEGGNLVIYYRDGEHKLPLIADFIASPDVFYRFEVSLHIADNTYDLRVFEPEGEEPLGAVEGARFRGNLREVNHVMLNGTPGAYFDEIRISSP